MPVPSPNNQTVLAHLSCLMPWNILELDSTFLVLSFFSASLDHSRRSFFSFLFFEVMRKIFEKIFQCKKEFLIGTFFNFFINEGKREKEKKEMNWNIYWESHGISEDLKILRRWWWWRLLAVRKKFSSTEKNVKEEKKEKNLWRKKAKQTLPVSGREAFDQWPRSSHRYSPTMEKWVT